jgi:hypothetical protein
MAWEKVPLEHAARLAALMTAYPDAEPRKMFGCPCYFIGGNLCLGAHEANFMLRLPAEAQAELLQHPAVTHFAPMGAPMRDYLLLTPAFHEDDALFCAWIDRSVAYTRTLPPPAPKAKKK